MKKIYITQSSQAGLNCQSWAKSLISDSFQLVDNELECQILFSVFHNKIYTSDFIASKENCFNFHGGILPDYRGSCTINWAIINGEKETGVSLHVLDSGIDTGNIIDIYNFPIADNDTSGTVYSKSESVVFLLFKKWFLKLIEDDFESIPQTKLNIKAYKKVDIELAKDLTRFIRAFDHQGKEKAFYYNSSGNKIYLSYE